MPVCSECYAKLDSMHVSGCWRCGAGFRSESNWKPVHASVAPDTTSTSPPASALRSIVLFTVPAWGVVLLILMGKVAGGGTSDAGSVLLLVVGALLPLGFLRVIWSSKVLGIAGKVFSSILYYVASSVAMFVVGWASIGYLFQVV